MRGRPGSAAACRAAACALLALSALFLPTGAHAQVPAEPLLRGQVLLGDTAMTSGTVVLHHVSQVAEGELDSASVAPDGSFRMMLPRMPDEASGEMYFASIRHDGVMYFGQVIQRPVDLDSLYLIQAYDTMSVPPDGIPVALEARSVFFEQGDGEWVVTDVLQLRYDGDRTVLPRAGGDVWRYPLPAGARDFSTEREMSTDIVTYERGDVVFRGALQPGARMIVVRYSLDSLAVTVPTPGETGMLDVLVREPAPTMEVEGLAQDQSIQFDAGVTYRRFVGQNVALPQVRLALVEEEPPPPVQWIAVVLALVLAGGGLMALRGSARRGAAEPAPVEAVGRQALLLEIARLDEEYEREKSPSAARTREYRKRRAALMERLRSKV